MPREVVSDGLLSFFFWSKGPELFEDLNFKELWRGKSWSIKDIFRNLVQFVDLMIKEI